MQSIEAGKQYTISGAVLYAVAQALWQGGRDYAREMSKDFDDTAREQSELDLRWLLITGRDIEAGRILERENTSLGEYGPRKPRKKQGKDGV